MLNPIMHINPVIFEEKTFGSSRNEVFEALAEEGIGARKYFYPVN